EVLPRVPVPQWVLSLPHRLRYLLAWNHVLARAVLGVYVRALLSFHRVTQRFGGGLNLNIHFHTLLFDGVFVAEGDGDTLGFQPLPPPPPTDEEVGVVLARIASRVQRLLERRCLNPSDADPSPRHLVVEACSAVS